MRNKKIGTKVGAVKRQETTRKLSKFKLAAFSLFVLVLLGIGAVNLYSAPPTTKYDPGETLDPDCAPGELNCSVKIDSNWSRNSQGIHYESGNVGIGISFPAESFHVSGNSLFAGNVRLGSSNYLNYGATAGVSGYGFRDHDGVLEFKDYGGSWTPFSSLSGGGGAEVDPTVPSHVKSITTSNISNWNAAFGWGDHSLAGYLKNYTETDPTVPSHVKLISTGNISNWNTAYSWGDHSLAGYLTGYTETDPTVPLHVKNILTADISNWNAAFGWGDHSVEGYIKSFTETDPTVPSHVKNITMTDILNWSAAYSWGDHSLAGYLKATDIDSSAKLSVIVSDGVGTGNLVFNTNPYFSGNVRLNQNGYLNWDNIPGENGYGLRDNSGVLEFKDAGGNWIAFNSLGGSGGSGGPGNGGTPGEGDSLWTLHSNGQDIYRNDGNVGINTSNPTAKLESTSDTVAGWFRGVLGEAPDAWDFQNSSRDGDLNVYLNEPGMTVCRGGGSSFSSDGKRLFLTGNCYLSGLTFAPNSLESDRLAYSNVPSHSNSPLSVHQYELDQPWDINTAQDSGKSYDPFDDLDFHPDDVTFSPDGLTMYVLSPGAEDHLGNPRGGQISEYSLDTPWDLSEGGVHYVKSVSLGDYPPLYEVSNFQFNDTGTTLFISGDYYNSTTSTGGDFWSLELSTPYDISSLNTSPVSMVNLYAEGGFFFTDDGGTLYILDRYSYPNYDFVELKLIAPWDYQSPPAEANHFPYLSNGGDYVGLIVHPEGKGYYVSYSGYKMPLKDKWGMGIYQHSVKGEIIGGEVLVDGSLGVGLTKPKYKLHVVSHGGGAISMFTNDSGSCWVDPSDFGMNCSSDERLKRDILTVGSRGEDSSLSRLLDLELVSYRWAASSSSSLNYGFIAQDVQKIFPELVSEGPLLDPNDPSQGRSLGISYAGFTPFIVDAIKELDQKVSFVSLLGDGEETDLGGSLLDIIKRALKDAVLKVRKLIATEEICVGDVCFNEEEAKQIKQLLGEENRERSNKGSDENKEEEAPSSGEGEEGKEEADTEEDPKENEEDEDIENGENDLKNEEVTEDEGSESESDD